MKTSLTDRKPTKNDIFYKIAITVGAVLVVLIFSYFAPPEADMFDKLGMVMAILALGLFLCRFPVIICLYSNLFVLCSAAGSILKVYDKFPGYDRIVHFVSGMLLAYIGMFMAKWLFNRLNIRIDTGVIILLGGVFSFACAGFWEITEYLTYLVTLEEVQHGNVDTMGDIVAGFLGAVTFQCCEAYANREYYTVEWFRNLIRGSLTACIWDKYDEKKQSKEEAENPKIHS